MKKSILLLLFIILFISPSCTWASDRPTDYYKQDIMLASSLSDENIYGKVNRSLYILRTIYPEWKSKYELNVFDCSQMSEALRYWFYKCGIECNYCYSGDLGHIWIEVPINGDKIIIESTSLKIKPKEEWAWYYQYNDVVYNDDVYFTLNKNEFDWWNSPMFRKDD